jgi:hypothetical protein
VGAVPAGRASCGGFGAYAGILLAWGSVLLGLAITGVLHDPPSYLAGLLLANGVV